MMPAFVLSFALLATVGVGGFVGDEARNPSASSFIAIETQSATVPSEPMSLSATPGILRVSLYWDSPVSDGGSSIVSYNVYRAGPIVGVSVEYKLIKTVQTEAYMDYSVQGNRTYYYRITAVNSAGEGPPSDSISVTPKLDPYHGYNYVPPLEPEGGIPTIATIAIVAAIMGAVLFLFFSRAD